MKLPEAIHLARTLAAESGEPRHVVLRAEYEPHLPGAHAEWQVLTDAELQGRGVTPLMIARTFEASGRPAAPPPSEDGDGEDTGPVRRTRTVRPRLGGQRPPPPPSSD